MSTIVGMYLSVPAASWAELVAGAGLALAWARAAVGR